MKSRHMKFRMITWRYLHFRKFQYLLDTVQSDHIHPVHTSPGKLHQELEKSNEKVLSLKKKFKSSQQKSRRLKKKVTSLKEIVK